MKTSYKVLIAVSLVVGLIAIALAWTAYVSQSTQQPLGGTYANNSVASGAGGGIDFGALPVNYNWVGGKIIAKSNSAFYKNVSGQTEYFENVEVSTDGTASSTYKVYAYATTSAPRTIYDFSAPVQNANTLIWINGFAIATSSVATTTSSDDTKGTGAGPAAGSVIQVPNNSYLDIVLVQNTTGCNGATSVCETATSTARGFNLQWRAVYHN